MTFILWTIIKSIKNDTFIFHFPVKHKKHRPRGNRFVRKNSVLSAPSGVRTLDTLIKSQVLYQLS